jgi:predicted RNase H-like nuclease (RuvC/YqgF family)
MESKNEVADKITDEIVGDDQSNLTEAQPTGEQPSDSHAISTSEPKEETQQSNERVIGLRELQEHMEMQNRRIELLLMDLEEANRTITEYKKEREELKAKVVNELRVQQGCQRPLAVTFHRNAEVKFSEVSALLS